MFPIVVSAYNRHTQDTSSGVQVFAAYTSGALGGGGEQPVLLSVGFGTAFPLEMPLGELFMLVRGMKFFVSGRCYRCCCWWWWFGKGAWACRSDVFVWWCVCEVFVC